MLVRDRRDADPVLSHHLEGDPLRNLLGRTGSVEQAKFRVGVHIDEPRREAEPRRVDRPLRASGCLADAGDGSVREEDVSVERVVAGAVDDGGVPKFDQRHPRARGFHR